jgi:sulfur carrier protein ThiS
VRITFKAYATLGEYLPRAYEGHARQGNELAMDVPEGTTLEAVIGRFPLPRALVHLVLVNGEYVLPSERDARVLREGDAIAIWPPIAGG